MGLLAVGCGLKACNRNEIGIRVGLFFAWHFSCGSGAQTPNGPGRTKLCADFVSSPPRAFLFLRALTFSTSNLFFFFSSLQPCERPDIKHTNEQTVAQTMTGPCRTIVVLSRFRVHVIVIRRFVSQPPTSSPRETSKSTDEIAELLWLRCYQRTPRLIISSRFR